MCLRKHFVPQNGARMRSRRSTAADALSAGCGSPQNDAAVEGTGAGALSARCESPQADDGFGRIHESSADATFVLMMRSPPRAFLAAGSIMVSVDCRGSMRY